MTEETLTVSQQRRAQGRAVHRRLADILPPLLLGLALFGVWMHQGVLDPRNIGWLLAGEDRGQSAIGLAAYWRAGAWPSLRAPLLAAPDGLALLFTDSIPLLGAVFGPFGRWLAGTQLVGPWYLACCLLQAAFAWALVRRCAPDRLTALLGAALLAGLPVLFNRYGHASLCAQWLLLWALWVFVDEARSRQPLWWAAVLGVAALVHSYLLLMAAAVWGGALLRALSRGPERTRTLAGAVGALALIAAIAWWHGALAGGYASTRTYGAFPMALDAWWNPANPHYSALLPSSPDDRARGYEGFQYLGAGLLALVAVALIALALRRADGSRVARLAWLIPGFVVLAVIAIGPQPRWWGQPIAMLHLAPALTDALDPVRAAGRLMWPATYAMALAAITVVARLPRAALLLGAALAVQVIDLAPMLVAIRATSARAEDGLTFTRTRSPAWQDLVARAGAIEFVPADTLRDLGLSEEIAWRAVASCRPVRSFYAARQSRATLARIAADERAVAAGRIDRARLYVLLDGAVPPTLAPRIRRLDGIAIIPPQRAMPAGCARPLNDR